MVVPDESDCEAEFFRVVCDVLPVFWFLAFALAILTGSKSSVGKSVTLDALAINFESFWGP